MAVELALQLVRVPLLKAWLPTTDEYCQGSEVNRHHLRLQFLKATDASTQHVIIITNDYPNTLECNYYHA
jgi:hypothetical protein